MCRRTAAEVGFMATVPCLYRAMCSMQPEGETETSVFFDVYAYASASERLLFSQHETQTVTRRWSAAG